MCKPCLRTPVNYLSGLYRVADFPALMKWLKVVATMSTTTLIIIIVVLLLLFGGGGGYFYRRGR
jgi:hypothetical protein